MQSKTLVLIFSLLGFQSYVSIACSCAYITTFCEAWQSSRQNENEDHYLVVRGTVIDKIQVDDFREQLLFRIDESFHNPHGWQEVKISEGIHSCQQAVGHIAVQTDLILHASILVNDGDTTLALSSCEVPPLLVLGGQVLGSINNEISQMSLEDFRELPPCDAQKISLRKHVSFIDRMLYIDILDAFPGDIRLAVYDLARRLIQHQKIHFISPQNIEWPIKNLSNGVYLLEVRDERQHFVSTFSLLDRKY